MSTPIRSSPLSFLKFWWQCFKSAARNSWGHYDHLTNIATIVQCLSVLGFAAIWISKHFRGADMNFWFLALPVGVAGISFLVQLVRAPFEFYRETIQAAEAKEQTLKVENEALRTDLAEATKEDHTRMDRKIARQALGNLLLNLQNRLATIKMLNSFSYDDEIRREEEKKTYKLIDDTFGYIEKFCDTADAASFMSAKPERLSQRDTLDHFSEQAANKQAHMEFIEAYIFELKKVIDRYPSLE